MRNAAQTDGSYLTTREVGPPVTTAGNCHNMRPIESRST